MLAAQASPTLITVSSHLPSVSESVAFAPKCVSHCIAASLEKEKREDFISKLFFLIKRTSLMIFGSIKFAFFFFFVNEG